MKQLITFALFLYFTSGAFDLRVNEDCSSHLNDQEGICMDAKNCIEYKTKRNMLYICSFKGRVPIVCCPKQKLSVLNTRDVNKKRISAKSKDFQINNTELNLKT